MWAWLEAPVLIAAILSTNGKWRRRTSISGLLWPPSTGLSFLIAQFAFHCQRSIHARMRPHIAFLSMQLWLQIAIAQMHKFMAVRRLEICISNSLMFDENNRGRGLHLKPLLGLETSFGL